MAGNIHPSRPVVGEWYRRPGGEIFEVVAIDEDDATVDIQYFDGTVEELDLETWDEQLILEAEPPEDWSGSVDIDTVEYDLDEGTVSPADWNGPLDYLDRVE